MALVLIELEDVYMNWKGDIIHDKKLCDHLPWRYKKPDDNDIYIFDHGPVNLTGEPFWEELVRNISGDIYVYIHFGHGDKDKDKISRINEVISKIKAEDRIKDISDYSIGRDEPKGMAAIYEKSKNKSIFDSTDLIKIFKKKGFVEEKIRQTKETENQQLHITALLLLLQVNQKSMKAASDLLDNLKECLSAMKQGGIDTTNLVNYLDSKPLNDLLPEADMREMEKECRKILQILEKKKLPLETDKQHAN